MQLHIISLRNFTITKTKTFEINLLQTHETETRNAQKTLNHFRTLASVGEFKAKGLTFLMFKLKLRESHPPEASKQINYT